MSRIIAASATSDVTGSRTISDLYPALARGSVRSADLVDECLARVAAARGGNAFTFVNDEGARSDAAQADREIAAGRWRGPLHGIPIAVKDLVDVSGMPTTSGSAVPPRLPSADAPVIARLKDAGAVIVGKTNLHEFAFGTTSEESAFGPVRHPRDRTRSAGGSSGGSAAALAGGCCLGAVGTDTGGSIRIPSAACGTAGLKPTLGELPCVGVVPLSTTLDHVGPMALTVRDLSLLFQAMQGIAPRERPPAAGRWRFGVPRTYFCDSLDGGVRAALDRAGDELRRAGHDVHDVEVAHARWTPHAYLHIVLPEASWYHAGTLARHAGAYSPGVRLRLEMGGYVLAEDYVRAMRLREVLTRAVDDALDRCDVLLLPALAIPAPVLGEASVEVDGRREPVRAIMLKLTQLFNITGHPAIALPAGDGPDGLPRGLQLVGRRGSTERLLDVAAAVERYSVAGPGSVGGGTG